MVKKIWLTQLHHNPLIQRSAASGVELVAGRIAKIQKSRILPVGGCLRAPCAALASPSQLRVGRSVWEFSWVCLTFPGSNPGIQSPTTSCVSRCSRQIIKIQIDGWVGNGLVSCSLRINVSKLFRNRNLLLIVQFNRDNSKLSYDNTHVPGYRDWKWGFIIYHSGSMGFYYLPHTLGLVFL